jgi:hypothetical protein
MNKTHSIWLESAGDGYAIRKYVKSFTYEPKIPKVLNGEVKQTIRPLGKHPMKRGDHILFHGWSGRPYWSEWSWRLNVIVSYVDQIEVFQDGIWFPEGLFFKWETLNLLAELDGIAKEDGMGYGESMGELFNRMHPDLIVSDGKNHGKRMEIIRWV